MTIDAEERTALAEAVRAAASGGPRDFLVDRGTPQRDAKLWHVIAEQMGLTGLLVPEEHGGAGAGVVEMALVLEELARVLAVVPALSSMGAAVGVLRTLGTTDAERLLIELVSGSTTATVAWPAPESHHTRPVLTAAGTAEAGAKVAVSGSTGFVLDGCGADIVLAPARCGDSVVVVAVETADSWVNCTPMDSLDLTRGLAEVTFTEVPGTVLAVDADLQSALDLTLVLIAAEQIGIAQQCHDTAVAWAKERVQFDRPIGQFQAIKHQLVDLLMDVELARSSLDVAVQAADAYLEAPQPVLGRALSVAASVAKARCGDAAMRVADQSLHILGGIGFTWEHDAHLYFRRAKTLEVLLGSPAEHRRRFTTLLLEDARNG
ncbi:acyl-CoA dehydrogenase family protein [Mycolicibacterium neoaurum]|uniref:acyl-CoA dehydrogenase family protein n=1 Tax=Mycolicibacterium neoaurum TaxID=1795 RepID=UPI002673A739|nr:acyl-CoA dehydrogenase family protein [Mycolicibacterium neoaurum]MDO3402758.1 acyl-CoA dehydrogenase family protein [Mycolicibacterium neoaurum]